MTLVETMCAVVVVGVMLVAALTTVGAAARNRLLRTHLCRAPASAQQLMGEIMQAFYEEPDTTPVFGPEPGESSPTMSRTAFDDVDDYAGLSESPPTNRDGSSVQGFDGWRWAVSVAYVHPSDPGTVSMTDTGLKRIAVTVTDPAGKMTNLIALRSRFSGYDQLPASETTYITAAKLTLQVGQSSDTKTVTAVNLLNQVP